MTNFEQIINAVLFTDISQSFIAINIKTNGSWLSGIAISKRWSH